MHNIHKNTPLANNHISVDCVVIGFDGEQLKVLLVKRAVEDNGEVYHDMKLPGSLIYMDEDLDEAAQRVLYELTGLKNVNLMQFKAFGSKNRTSNPKDVRWLERAMQSRVERIVTIAYLSMVKIDRTLDKNLDDHQACWIALKDVKTLAFDHNLIIKEAAKLLTEHYHISILVKGGHLEGDLMSDFLYTSESASYIYKEKKIESNNLHGTGCTLSSAIATYLAKGYPLHESIRHAKAYVTQAILAGKELHIGHGNGPLWHFPDSVAQMCTICAVVS
jgi:ADP-ribose pyrophosphatase YjhB (NUDIX family)